MITLLLQAANKCWFFRIISCHLQTVLYHLVYLFCKCLVFFLASFWPVKQLLILCQKFRPQTFFMYWCRFKVKWNVWNISIIFPYPIFKLPFYQKVSSIVIKLHYLPGNNEPGWGFQFVTVVFRSVRCSCKIGRSTWSSSCNIQLVSSDKHISLGEKISISIDHIGGKVLGKLMIGVRKSTKLTINRTATT